MLSEKGFRKRAFGTEGFWTEGFWEKAFSWRATAPKSQKPFSISPLFQKLFSASHQNMENLVFWKSAFGKGVLEEGL